MVTYTSDRFEDFKEYALVMIKNGDAYMDDTSQVRNASLVHSMISMLYFSLSRFLFIYASLFLLVLAIFVS